MAEKTSKGEFDDEFNFEAEAQDFGGADLELAAPAQRKLAKGPLIVGSLVILFVVWKLWGIFAPSKPKAAADEKVVLQKVEPDHPTGVPAVPDAAVPAIAGSPASPELPGLNLTNGGSDPKLKESIAKLEEMNHEATMRLKNLEESLKQMAVNLNGYQQSVSGINQNLDKVSSSVAELSQNIKNMQSAPAPVAAAPAPSSMPSSGDAGAGMNSTSSAPSPSTGGAVGGASGGSAAAGDSFANPTLSVHAIIPGRVWLKNKEGKTLTAVEGDEVETYGKIVAIDAPNGVVMTSSGTTLR